MKSMIASLLLVSVVALSDAKSARLTGLLGQEISTKKVSRLDKNVNKAISPEMGSLEYLGAWYEMERIEYVYDLKMDCSQATYSMISDGRVVLNTVGRTAEGEVTQRFGMGTITGPGVREVEYEGSTTSGLLDPPSVYQVLETDYKTFSAVYNCDQIEEFRFQYGWIHSRNLTIDDEAHDQACKIFENFGIDLKLFNNTYQGADCPYLS